MSMAVVDQPGVTSMSLHANPRAKSCLRSVLTEYGLKEERRRRKPRRQVQSAGWHRETHKPDDSGKLTLKQEKHLQVLKDLDVLRDHYYDTYMDMLRERIAQQELKMREREARMARRQKSAPPVKKKEKHVLVDDKHYLQNVAKSEVYEIVREESRLIQAGFLRTPSDLEEFWSRHMLKNAAKNMARRYNVSDASTLLSDSAFAEEFAARPSLSFLSKIREEEEEEMSAKTVEKKAARRTIAHKGTASRKGMKDIDEILFPKVEMPKLHCFEMELGPKEEDPATIEAKNEQSLRDKERWLFRKRLQKMYQLAMTNTASAKRILANHDPEDVEIMTDSSDVRELINLDHFITKTDLQRYSSQSNALVPYRGQGQGQGQGHSDSHVDSGQGQSSLSREARTAVSEDVAESSETKSRAIESATSNSRSSATSRAGRPKSSSSRGSQKDPQAPLSMDDILPEARIMEAKCLSTLWTNYMFTSEGNNT